MAVGTVKWFNDAKGFGFILRGDGADVFVHHTSILGEGFRTLASGETVEYEETTGPKGLAARSVRRNSESNAGEVLPESIVRS